MEDAKKPQSLDKRMLKRIRASKGASVFSAGHFLDFGTRSAVDQALSRLVKAGKLRRVARGLYDLPRKHPKLGVLHPRPEAIVSAIAQRDGTEFHEHEASAANRLRLTEQVPGQMAYLTPGPSRTIKAGKVTIQLKHRSARKVSTPAPMSVTVFSALRNLGKAHVTPQRTAHLVALLSEADRHQLMEDLPKAPIWMHKHLRRIAGEEITA